MVGGIETEKWEFGIEEFSKEIESHVNFLCRLIYPVPEYLLMICMKGLKCILVRLTNGTRIGRLKCVEETIRGGI